MFNEAPHRLKVAIHISKETLSFILMDLRYKKKIYLSF